MTSSKRRHLLAVMFTDVVGYTALMQRDEEAARTVRRRHRDELEAAISAHSGDLLQYLGDGSLTVFPSVVDAVRAAIAVQRGLRKEPVVPLRIGIHEGDISYDTQGAYGDSVNIASRIQSLGTAGSILVSAKARDEIKNQPDISTTLLGEFELKNVEEPLEVYGIVADMLTVPTRDDVLAKVRSATELNATIRLNTALAGRYSIKRELGEGGMAAVYLADDLKHERHVALKVLKPELAAVVGAERFLAEIKTTAHLQHPNILPLFDSGEADGLVYYVMPYVEGESLGDQLDREQQLPVDQAVKIALDLAEALQAAHEQGVVHRDIKPGNILISRGKPLIADFGIALALSAAGAGERLTETGLSLGTPYYMSPEQATGDQHVGPPSDIYALGAVLYEMLVGEPPHTGTTAQAVLGRIIAGEPVSTAKHRPSVPANVDGAICRALEKLPADRFTSAQEFARALGDEHFRYGELATAGAGAAVGPWKQLTVVVTALAAVLAITLTSSLLRSEPPATLARFASPFEEGQAPTPFSFIEFTADGSALVYIGPGESGQGQQLWVRRWAELDARPIPGTEGAQTAVLTPDGREVAFAATSGALRVVEIESGQSRPLVEQVSSVWAWTSDGTVYFTEAAPSSVLGRVLTTGGGREAVESVTELQEGELAHGILTVLPGEKMGVFQVYEALSTELWAIDLDTGEREFLTVGNTPRYASTGHLLFGTPDGVLMAAPIDPGSAEFTAPPVPVADSLTVGPSGNVSYAVSEGGTLIYLFEAGSGGDIQGDVDGVLEAVWVRRSGDAAPADPGWRFNALGDYFGLRLSLDGTRLALSTLVDGNTDIWIKQLPDGPFERLTFDDDMETYPVWSTDGQFVTYVKGPLGADYDVWRRRADRTGAPELLLDDERTLAQGRQTLDGEWMVFSARGQSGTSGERDIVGFRPAVDNATVSLIATAEFAEQDPALSPDGRWLAYTSDETGRSEVYVSPFPNVDSDRVLVSTNGGFGPLWAHGGRELFFVDADRRLVAAEIETASAFGVLERETLFILGSEYFVIEGADFYDIAPDDQRFLMARLADDRRGSGDDRFIVVTNWFEELRQRLGN